MKNDVSYAGVNFPIADVFNESIFTTTAGTSKRTVHIVWNEISTENSHLIMNTLRNNRTGDLAYDNGTVSFKAYYKPGARAPYINYESGTKFNVSATFEEI